MGIWYSDKRMDWHEIEDEKVRKNAECVAAITLEDNLFQEREYSALIVKTYGKVFNLCEFEPFRDQPVSVGPLASGFLVQEDIIATASHFVENYEFAKLRFVFGYKMINPSTPAKQIPNENIYKGKKIIQRVHNRLHLNGDGADWALIELDRKVKGQVVSVVSENEIYPGQPVYLIGHPVGLPLKYISEAKVGDIYKAYFTANLDVYMGDSGSPVFNSDTHEVIGICVRGYTRDFRWTGKGWNSVVYPNHEYAPTMPEFCRVSEFSHLIGK